MQERVPIPAEDFREMRGESDEATAPESRGFFIARVFMRFCFRQRMLRENDADEDE